ncbi:MAG: hypothetical protein CMI96_04735 [Pelagibacteraceae bacterium]|nr:hypothetical protein [Pelagibacteraceae bacterium]PPR09966.1 MAG: hypothetical protein CFH41_02020 [Alphaproteobacteria bacterium MarineAlpha11_Bin1]|tara:strand:+ start:1967 stop:2329 length:363 start_codon:yes stop_codon:yes gene_type:complete
MSEDITVNLDAGGKSLGFINYPDEYLMIAYEVVKNAISLLTLTCFFRQALAEESKMPGLTVFQQRPPTITEVTLLERPIISSELMEAIGLENGGEFIRKHKACCASGNLERFIDGLYFLK